MGALAYGWDNPHLMRHSHPPARESGQAAVEAALIVPMMVFLVLGIIQLSMMHHARLMNEYAAYRAARAGIVNHGHCRMMRNSAFVSLLPTLGPPQAINLLGAKGRTDTLWNALLLYKSYTAVAASANQNYLPDLPIVRVEVLNPKRSQLSQLFTTYGSHLNRQEIDFDDIRDERVIEGNLLSVRVTYFYNMRIPFANKLIHGWYLGLEYLNDLRGVQFENQKAYGAINETMYLRGRGAAKGGDFARMAMLATVRGLYVVPLVSTYSMRMQSNLMRKHVEPCAID